MTSFLCTCSHALSTATCGSDDLCARWERRSAAASAMARMAGRRPGEAKRATTSRNISRCDLISKLNLRSWCSVQALRLTLTLTLTLKHSGHTTRTHAHTHKTTKRTQTNTHTQTRFAQHQQVRLDLKVEPAKLVWSCCLSTQGTHTQHNKKRGWWGGGRERRREPPLRATSAGAT